MLAIKVGFLVSYDYNYLKNSLPPIYDAADKIVLAIDKNRLTWSGNTIVIEDEFFRWIKSIDVQEKIEIYEDSFYESNLTNMQNETRERNMLAQYMGEGGWHIQIDIDEYFVDFKNFIDYLHELENKKKHINCVEIEWMILYKKTESNIIIIRGNGGRVPCATTKPEYVYGRYIKNPHSILYPNRVIHDGWARTEKELWTKLNNWGHNTDFDIEAYFHYWKVIDEKNYMYVKNLHPIYPEVWSELEKVKASNIQELLRHIKLNENLLAVEKSNKFRRYMNLLVPPIIPKLYKKLFK